jgi:hypothetical protein
MFKRTQTDHATEIVLRGHKSQAIFRSFCRFQFEQRMTTSSNSATPKRGRGNPAWKRGGPSPNPQGRAVGIPNKFSVQQAQAVARSGALPLDIIMAMARRDVNALKRYGIPLKQITPRVQRWALHESLPYTSVRTPIGVGIGINGQIGVNMNGGGGRYDRHSGVAISMLSDKSLAHLELIKIELAAIEEHLLLGAPLVVDLAQNGIVRPTLIGTEQGACE